MFKNKNTNSPERTPLRRQPTLERSIGTSVFSYHANRATAKPGLGGRHELSQAPAERAKAHFRHGLFKRGRVIVVLIVVVAGLIVNSFLSRTPMVIPVSTAQNAVFLQERSIYEQAAARALQRSPFNATKLTIDSARIETDVRAAFPELQQVTVSVPFAGTTVRVYVEPSTPRLLLNSGNRLYVLDESGRAVMESIRSKQVGKLGLPVVTDESNLPVTIGKAALPSTSVAFITEVVGQLKHKKIDIASLTLPAGNSELHVRIAGVPYYVKFNLQGNAREEAGAYLAVKDQLAREKKTPGTYIDVRVEERAYYK